MKIISKCFLGILVFSLSLVSNVAVAFEPVVGVPVIPVKIISKTHVKGVITAVNSDSYTIDIVKGKKTVSKEIKFNKDTKFQIKKDRVVKAMNVKVNNKTKQKTAKHKKSIKPNKPASPTNQDYKVGDTILVNGGLVVDQSILATSINKISDHKAKNTAKLKVKNINN